MLIVKELTMIRDGIKLFLASCANILLYGNPELIISITRGKSSALRAPSHQDGV